MSRLQVQHKHIMRLIKRDCDLDGWATVSKVLYPMLKKNMPERLIEFDDSDGLRAKLTDEGENVLAAMEWLD